MGKYDNIKVGEKLPGTYCPVCGETGLLKKTFDGATWAICPMKNGEPTVKTLKDAHTGYVISTTAAPVKATPKPAPKVETEKEGVDNA